MIGRNKVRAAQEVATLQYANGKSNARPLGAGRFQPYVGFHSEVGRDDELDAVLRELSVPQIEIKHQRPGGAEIVRHWEFGERITFYPVTSGPIAPTVVASLSERNIGATAEAGIALRWEQGERSRMALRGYLGMLARAGHIQLMQLSVKSRMTDVLFAALLDHGRVCEALDRLIDRTKHPDLVSYHEVALPLEPGDEQEWGKGDTTTVVPFKSGHPQDIDAPYLRTVWRPESVHAAALREWEGIQAWAREECEGEKRQPAAAGSYGRRPSEEDLL